MVKKALLIGINYVGQDAELSGCVNDSSNVKQLLISKYGFEKKNIHVLCDSGPDHSKSKTPTMKHILSGIDWLVKDVEAGDSLVFAYSGHGSTERDLNNDESDHEDETLCPVDYEKSGLLIDDIIKQRLADKVPEGAKLVGIVDACHSGSVFDLKYSVKPASIKSKYILPYLGHMHQTALQLFGLKPEASSELNMHHETETKGKVICLSGCKDDQTSADTEENGKATGALTWALLETLKKHNYDISCIDLLHKIRELLKQHKYGQIPQMSFGSVMHVEEKFSFENL